MHPETPTKTYTRSVSTHKMRKSIYILVILLAGVINSCYNYKEDNCRKGLPDKKYDFLESVIRRTDFNYLETITDIREFGFAVFGDSTRFKWIRQPENMIKFYNSANFVGLFNFISQQEYNKPLFTNHYRKSCWNNKSLNEIVDNFLNSYVDTTGFDKYYIEFWKRREKEGNKKAVYEILNDLQLTYNNKNIEVKEFHEVDTILAALLYHEVKVNYSDSAYLYDNITDYFDYLRNVGLYVSATNLIQTYSGDICFRERYNRMIKLVETDSLDCDDYWNWRYSAEWYKDIYDEGP